ncbi:unnamed protein product [Laminaria digitata]
MLVERRLSSGVVTSPGTTNRTELAAAVPSSSSVSEKPVPAVRRAGRLSAAPRFGPWLTSRRSSSSELAGRLAWQPPAESSSVRASAFDGARSAGQRRVLRNHDNTSTARFPIATGSSARRQGITRARLATRGASAAVATAATLDDEFAATRQSTRVGYSSGAGNVGRAGGEDRVPVIGDGGGTGGEDCEGPRDADDFEMTGEGEDSSELLGQSAVGQGVAHRLAGRKQDEKARFGSEAFQKDNRQNQEEEEEEQEEEFEWRVGRPASSNKRPRATEPQEGEGEEDEEEEFDCFIVGASSQTKEHQAKEKSEAGTEERSAGQGVLFSPSPARAYSSSQLVQNRHRQLPTTRDTDSTDARGSGAFVGSRNVRRRLTTTAGSGTTFSLSSSSSPSPASSPPSPLSHRGFGLRGPLQCGMETEEVELKDRLLRHREVCPRTGSGSTQNGNYPVFANAGALCESDGDDESSFVGRVEGDARGAAGKGVLFDSDDDEPSSVGRVGGETRGAAGKGRAGCEWRRGQRGPQHGRGRSSNVSSAHVSSHFSVGCLDKFRFTGARA